MTPDAGVPVSPPRRTDRAAAERLWAAHERTLRRYLRVLGAAGPDLDDLLQETFVVLLQREFEDRGPAAAATFLRTTARFLFLRRHRDRLPQVEAADAVWDRRCGDDDGAGYLAALRACLERLPARSRRLVQLGYDDGLGRDAIARELGLTADGVKTALRRVREVLRQCIERRLGS
jgi:RNA polymerase sigma-70 factor (ECF subfamily)